MKLIFAAVVLAAFAAATAQYSAPAPARAPAPAPTPASASDILEEPQKCSCSMPSSIQSGYEADSAPIFKAEAVEVRDVGDPHYTYTVMKVKAAFRGCPPQTEKVIVKSPSTAEACGVTFTPGKTYVVSAKLARSSTPPPGLPGSMDVYMATSCNCNKEWGKVSYDDKVFLYYSPPATC